MLPSMSSHYFLFTKKKTFSHCWPIHDRSQGRDFCAQSLKWLESLKKERLLPPECTLRKSFLDECRGERFEKILVSLGHCVILQKMASRGVSLDPVLQVTDSDCVMQIEVNLSQKAYFLTEANRRVSRTVRGYDACTRRVSTGSGRDGSKVDSAQARTR